MRNSWRQKLIAALLAALAVSAVIAGAFREYKVYNDDETSRALGILTFQKISEAQLVVDATFTGTIRKDGKLFTTYDRGAERGKRACPT